MQQPPASRVDWVKVASVLTSVTAVVALFFTNRSLQATIDQLDLTAQSQAADRFGKAVDQLGSDKLELRLGGVYALERLAKDSPRDHVTVMEVLTAFIRTHAPVSACPALVIEPLTPADIQAALTVIGRRTTAFDSANQLNLSKTCLQGANLDGLDFSRTFFFDADMSRTVMRGTKFHRSTFTNTTLTSATMSGADLTEAELWRTKFTSADLVNRAGEKITWAANLNGAKLTRATLWQTDFTGAQVEGMDLTDARMEEVVGLSR